MASDVWEDLGYGKSDPKVSKEIRKVNSLEAGLDDQVLIDAIKTLRTTETGEYMTATESLSLLRGLGEGVIPKSQYNGKKSGQLYGVVISTKVRLIREANRRGLDYLKLTNP